MDYYEELGLTPAAEPEEIRDAYRVMARLLHPDQHSDPLLEAAAVRQMQRINRIYAVLSDPEQRRRYNADRLSENKRPVPVIIHARTERKQISTGMIVWVSAASVVLLCMIWLASREVPQGVAAYTRSAPVDHDEILALRERVKRLQWERDAAIGDAARRQVVRTGEPPGPQQPPVSASESATPAREPMRDTPQPTATLPGPGEANIAKLGLAGVWIYSKTDKTTTPTGLYAPEYIETIVTEENGQIRGRYRARFHITDRATDPDVVFHFAGPFNGASASLPWNGTGGSRGEVTLMLMDDNSLKVEWSASELGNLGLYKGTAVLARAR